MDGPSHHCCLGAALAHIPRTTALGAVSVHRDTSLQGAGWHPSVLGSEVLHDVLYPCLSVLVLVPSRKVSWEPPTTARAPFMEGIPP